MKKEEVLENCVKLCEKAKDKLKCISACSSQNGIDPVEGIIILTIEEPSFAPLLKVKV